MNSYYNIEPISLGVNLPAIKAYTFPVNSSFSFAKSYEMAKDLNLNTNLNLEGKNFSANFNTNTGSQGEVTPAVPTVPSTGPYIWKDS